LGLDQNQFRANDDGEPSGTAGRPILGQIDRLKLTNIGIIVVRYFGGTLLGTSGLINAYRESAADALAKSEIIEQILEDLFEIRFEYDKMPAVMNALKKLQINVLQQNFNEMGCLQISIRKQLAESTLLKMKALILKITTEEAFLLKEIKGISIFPQK
jgi:putative IMPACT (imprinted ancient) family translation regulator